MLGSHVLFFSTRDGGWFPTLRVLHQYPAIMKRLRADQGAIKFVLSGANIMCPGLTSPGATIHDEVRAALGPGGSGGPSAGAGAVLSFDMHGRGAAQRGAAGAARSL